MRRWPTALTIGLAAAALPATAWGAFAWGLSMSPSNAIQGQSTVFSLTVTNQGSNIECFEIDLPASFAILSLGPPNPSNGRDWDSTRNGNTVRVAAHGGGDELHQGDSVSFTITARPNAGGSYAWTNKVYEKHDCKGKQDAGPALQMAVTPSGPPPPTPVPTPVPTPTFAPAGTPIPTQRPAATSPGASVGPPSASPSAATGEPSSSTAPSRSPEEATTLPTSAPGGSGAGGPSTLRIAPLSDAFDGATDDLGMGLNILAMLDGPFVWFVPGAAVGVPGLLVIVFVSLQAVGAMAWIPAMRRLGGDDRGKNRPRPS